MIRYLTLLVVAMLMACQQGDFDSSAWKEADLLERTRVPMARALVSEDRLDGLTRSEVESLLGPPTPTDKWQEWDLIYVLGPTQYGVDYEWLVIRLGEDGKVTEYQLTAD